MMSSLLTIQDKQHSSRINIPLDPSTLDLNEILFLEEVENYFTRYPNTKHIDICLHDINGHMRGKRIDVSSLRKLSKGCYFPLSIYAMSLDGEVIEETGLGKQIGEPDYFCKPVLGSLQPCPLEPELNAQLLLSMKEGGADCEYEPRNILKNILAQLEKQHLYPCMAAELEFYLSDLNANAGIMVSGQCFDVQAPNSYQQVLDEVEYIAALQGINITGIVAESSAGQYEINIQHMDDILKLCDQIMLLKRTIKQVALKNGLKASFLAKPDLHKAGSGMHFHMSLLDRAKRNVFRMQPNESVSAELLKVISGLILLLPPSMAILAPNINSFRRFQKGNHVPLEANWGLNNRNVAIRIPCSDAENSRLEYRVAGADCNPYLTIAVILIGTLHGLTHPLVVPTATNQMSDPTERIFLATNQLDALALFKENHILQSYLGKRFMELWCAVKRAEHQHVYSQITSIEQMWNI